MRLALPAAIAVLCGALLVAGCGGDGSGGSSSTAPPAGARTDGGAPKQATAPNAPAGSAVVTCRAGAADAQGLRATAVDCDSARATMLRWERTDSCALAPGASRGSCSLGDFRCQAVRVDRGAAVSCARPGGDVAFVAKDPG